MHAKNLAYFVCTALALAFALPGLHATRMAQPSFVSRGACVSTAVNMAYLTILSVVLLCKPSLYERYRVILLASHLIGLSMPFSIFMHLMDTGVDDLFYQATLHLCLIPLMDLPVSATVLGAALLTPMYLALNWHSLQRQGLAPHSWGLLMLGRQAACCVAGVGGATLVHALVLEGFGSGSAGEPTMSTIVSTSASSSSYVRAGPGSCQPGVSARQLPGRRSGSVPPRVQQGLLLRLESFLLHVKRSLSDQDRTLLLALLFVATPLTCFLKFIRPFFDASLAHQPGPCELYVSFLCMFMLGSLQLDHMQQSIMSKLHISQELLCDLLPDHVVHLLMAAGAAHRQQQQQQLRPASAAASPAKVDRHSYHTQREGGSRLRRAYTQPALVSASHTPPPQPATRLLAGEGTAAQGVSSESRQQQQRRATFSQPGCCNNSLASLSTGLLNSCSVAEPGAGCHHPASTTAHAAMPAVPSDCPAAITTQGGSGAGVSKQPAPQHSTLPSPSPSPSPSPPHHLHQSLRYRPPSSRAASASAPQHSTLPTPSLYPHHSPTPLTQTAGRSRPTRHGAPDASAAPPHTPRSTPPHSLPHLTATLLAGLNQHLPGPSAASDTLEVRGSTPSHPLSWIRTLSSALTRSSGDLVQQPTGSSARSSSWGRGRLGPSLSNTAASNPAAEASKGDGDREGEEVWEVGGEEVGEQEGVWEGDGEGLLDAGSTDESDEGSIHGELQQRTGLPSLTYQLAEWHENISIIFSDVVGFTDMAQQVHPQLVMNMLNEMYTHFDDLCLISHHSIYKVETIGDSLMAAAGLMRHDPHHAASAVHFALAMRAAAAKVRLPTTGQPVQIRIGVHSGRAMSGIVGKLRRRFCLFGDTVNTASRMESSGQPGAVHISSATHALIRDLPAFQSACRGSVDVKGKGEMTTWWVEPSGARGAARLHSLPCSPPRIPQLSAAPEAAIAAGKLQGACSQARAELEAEAEAAAPCPTPTTARSLSPLPSAYPTCACLTTLDSASGRTRAVEPAVITDDPWPTLPLPLPPLLNGQPGPPPSLAAAPSVLPSAQFGYPASLPDAWVVQEFPQQLASMFAMPCLHDTRAQGAAPCDPSPSVSSCFAQSLSFGHLPHAAMFRQEEEGSKGEVTNAL